MIKNKKKIIIYGLISIIILLVIIIVVLGILFRINVNEIATSKNKIKKLEESSIDFRIEKDENIVIFGDSITEIYPADEIYGELPIVNSGTSGYKTTHLLDEMDSMVYQYNPTKVILLIGVNDVLYDTSEKTQQEAIRNIEKIISKIQKDRPNAKIYVESIYPVNKGMDTLIDFKVNNEVVKNMNKQIKNICKKKDIMYIDMYNELIDSNGNFDEQYTYDGLHPSTLGYAKITRVLMPYIYE